MLNSEGGSPCPALRTALGRLIAGEFGKSHGALTVSGSAALDLALASIGLRQGQRVGIPSFGCHEMAASVLRCGGVPVALPVDDMMLLTPSSLKAASGANLSAVLAVHQFGFICDIAGLRASLSPNVAIIEDAAQLLPLANHTQPAEVTITSFGSGKPVCLGEGGGAFANADRVERLTDRWTGPQRTRLEPVMPIAMSTFAVRPLEEAWSRMMDARSEITRQVNRVTEKLFAAGLIEAPLFKKVRASVPLVIPVRCAPKQERKLLDIAAQDRLETNKPHPIPLWELPMLRGRLDTSLLPLKQLCNEDVRLLDLRPLFLKCNSVAALFSEKRLCQHQ